MKLILCLLLTGCTVPHKDDPYMKVYLKRDAVHYDMERDEVRVPMTKMYFDLP